MITMISPWVSTLQRRSEDQDLLVLRGFLSSSERAEALEAAQDVSGVDQRADGCGRWNRFEQKTLTSGIN